MFLFLLNFIYACEYGEVDYSESVYCDIGGNFVDFKLEGNECLNDFECESILCVEGECKNSKYESILDEDKKSILNDFLLFLDGKQCLVEDQTYHCEENSNHSFLCGIEGVWEDKGEIMGECGILNLDVEGISGGNGISDDVENSDSNDGGDVGGGNQGSNNAGSSLVILKIYSPISQHNYGSNSVPLKVGGTAKYWSYSLNKNSKKSFTPNITLTLPVGNHEIIIYGKRYFNSFERKVKINFSVVDFISGGYCGDFYCSLEESCDDCESDCGECLIVESFCGDEICDDDESSYSCLEDCEPVKRHGKWLYFILVVIISLIILGILLWLYFYKKKKVEEFDYNNFDKSNSASNDFQENSIKSNSDNSDYSKSF